MDNPPDTKDCTACGVIKPLSAFSKNAAKRLGRQPRCRECETTVRLAKREKTLAYMRAYREANKKSLREKSLRYEAANRERIRTKQQAFCARHRERLRLKSREWAAAHPEKIQAYRAVTVTRHGDKLREWCRRDYKANKARYRAAVRRRRARLRGAGGSHTPADIDRLFDQQNGLCAVPPCRRPLVTEGRGKFHIDHQTPLSRGGTDDATNLALMCPWCNRSKGAKTMDEYLNYLAKRATR